MAWYDASLPRRRVAAADRRMGARWRLWRGILGASIAHESPKPPEAYLTGLNRQLNPQPPTDMLVGGVVAP